MRSNRITQPAERTCDHCGVLFTYDASRNPKQHFCGRACYWASRPLNRIPLAARFARRIDTNGPIPAHRPEVGPCHVWTGYCDPNGYGRIGSDQPGNEPMLAHRVAWFLHYGRWPQPGALHHCDNPPCVRWDHLFEGDQLDNMADRQDKGRSLHGEQIKSARLTEMLAIEILARYAAGGISQATLAALYGVHQMTVSDLVRGVTWKHLSRP